MESPLVTPQFNPQKNQSRSENKKRQRSSPNAHHPLKTPTKRKYIKLDYLNSNKENITSNISSNKFALLSSESDKESENSAPIADPPKPPPLFVANVKDINPLTHVLNEVAKNNFTLRVINHEEVKIQAKTAEFYDVIVAELKKRNTEYHSYQKKQDRPFRVVLKNMHCSSDTETLKTELEELGHHVIQITNIQNRFNKSKLPMFYIDMKVAPNNKDVYNIEFLLNTKIKFEAPNKKREIPQCTRCQRYGHTKNFCSRQPRCVKCAGNHQTSSCSIKERTSNVKCVHCEGNHPANYKGCAIYKQLQKTKNLSRKKEISSNEPETVSQPTQSNNQHFRRAGITYAQQLNQNYEEVSPPNNSSDLQELKIMMKGLVEQMSTMLNLLTTLVNKVINV